MCSLYLMVSGFKQQKNPHYKKFSTEIIDLELIKLKLWKGKNLRTTKINLQLDKSLSSIKSVCTLLKLECQCKFGKYSIS